MATVNTKTYKDNAGETTKAVQVTEKNFVGLGDWTNGDAIVKYNKKGEGSDHRVKLQTVKGVRVARVGDYIVRGDTRLKTFYVVKKDDFEGRWKLAA
jgi:uncharacterized Zn-binding protein involved in type VI secretion